MKSYRINNIKSFEDSGDIELKPITIFVGRNSCGKSSLIRFPVVLAQTAAADSDSPIKFYGKMVDYGNYEDVLHRNAQGLMEFSITYTIDVACPDPYRRRVILRRKLSELKDDLPKDIRDITLKVSIGKQNKKVIVEQVQILLGDKCLYYIYRIQKNQYCFYTNFSYRNGEFCSNQHSSEMKVESFDAFFPYYDAHDAIVYLYTEVNGEKPDEEEVKAIFSLINNLVISDEEKSKLSVPEKNFMEIWADFEYYSDMLRALSREFSEGAQDIRYIGPFRADPERIYRDPESNSSGVGVHGEHTSNVLLRDYRRKSKVINKISDWTKRVLGYEVVLKDVTNGMYQIMLKDRNGVETNIIDNGYGVSQVLPIVTEVVRLGMYDISYKYPDDIRWYEREHKRIVILEQPELHLHPAAQAELADLFVDSVVDGNDQKKLLIETHSEHLIRRLQVLVASKDCKLTPEMVKIYYVDKDDNGDAFVEEMKILPNGKFEKSWPSGFFDKGYLLSRELAKASSESI